MKAKNQRRFKDESKKFKDGVISPSRFKDANFSQEKEVQSGRNNEKLGKSHNAVKAIMSKKKERAIRKHFNKTVSAFKEKALKLAIENDYPYIEALLESLLIRMDENICRARADIRKSEWHFGELT